MSAQKVMVYLAIVVIAMCATEVNSTFPWGSSNNAANKSHNFVVGYRMAGDRLILRQNVIKNSSWMRIVVEEKTFNTSLYDRITVVQAMDQKTNGNGAYASLTAGGPGQNFVTLRFKSQRGHGINFVVEVYARP
ncbi:probable salivary secreted peptide [Hylaeus anthracinus]|uniref:probable salivary secreted peptide n=1 Tax=Hylaeus volcanicus TaxID=313075 RepID=UPI0023B7C043|nr:probable salivary secreted peptide [Hylaeus volcanicus]XP_054006683.1 probable salivary secreted peptide [Hylaeus anthracinus]